MRAEVDSHVRMCKNMIAKKNSRLWPLWKKGIDSNRARTTFSNDIKPGWLMVEDLFVLMQEVLEEPR